MSYHQETFNEREYCRTVPEGFEEIPGSRRTTRRFEAMAVVDVAMFQKAERVAEPCALAIGQSHRHIIMNDPGPQVFFLASRAARMHGHFDLKYALTFVSGSFVAAGRVTNAGEIPDAGCWSGIVTQLRAKPKAESLSGAAIWRGFDEARKQGFTADELVTAFGDVPEALEQARGGAAEVVLEHRSTLGGRRRMAFYRSVIDEGLLPGFGEIDLNAVVDEVFAEELRRTVSAATMPELLTLVESLLKGGRS